MHLRASKAPARVRRAVILAAAHGVIGLAFAAIAPGLEDRGAVFGVGLVFGLLYAVAGWSTWTGSRGGAIALIALNAFNIVAWLPYFADSDPVSMVVGGVISIVLSAATIVLLFHPLARAFRNRPAARRTAY